MSRFKLLFGILFILTFWVSDIYAGIVLKVLVINPSETHKKTVSLKAHLPQEVRLEDIIDKGDLEVAYDTQKGCYYVYKDFELSPKESVSREIEIEDIWRISQEELDSFRSETEKLAKLMSETEFFERANFLKNSVESKLSEIVERQERPAANANAHISDYRYNLKLIEAIKSDLQAAKSLLIQAKPISPYFTWRLIVGIVVFLGLLGLGYFLVWRRQIRVLPQPTFGFSTTESEDADLVERRKEKKEKKVGIEDIEKRLKNREE